MTPSDNADSGLAANRPAPTIYNQEKFYYATDTGELSFSTGTVWIEDLSGVNSSAASIGTLTGTDTTGAVQGSVFYYDGTQWVDSQNVLLYDSQSTLVIDNTSGAFVASNDPNITTLYSGTGKELLLQGSGVRTFVSPGDGSIILSADTIAIDGAMDFALGAIVNLPNGVSPGDAVAFGQLSDVARLPATQTFTAENTFQRSNTADDAISTQVAGDSFSRATIDADGALHWGGGSSAHDLTVERGFAGGLRVTGDQVQLFHRGNASFQGFVIKALNGLSPVFSTVTDVDNANRFFMNANGAMQWGDGNVGPDVHMYRTGAGLLRVDEDFITGGKLTSNGDTKLADSAGALIGMHGATPVAQAAAIPAPSTPGATYSQAEAQSAVDAINSIRTALAAIGITA